MHNPSHLANDNQNFIRNYQNKMADIHKERRKIQYEISEKQKKTKYLNDSQDLYKLSSFKSQTHLHQQPRKIVKTNPHSSQSIQQDNPQKPTIQNQNTTQNKNNDKPIVMPQAIADRNRRIFGGLSSYLRKAGEQLQSKVEKQKQQNSKLIMNKLISKQKEQRQEQKARKKELLENQLNKLKQQKKENQERMNKVENQMLSYIVKSHMNAIGKFNLTKTEPKLFWRSHKLLEDQEKIEKLSLYTEKQLKKQQEELLEKVMSYSEVFNHGKYMTQNQRQFYSNSIKNLFINHKNFILTKTQPNLFWKPNKTCHLVHTLLTDTAIRLDEKSAELNAANLDYYKSSQENLINQHNKQLSDEEQYDEQRN